MQAGSSRTPSKRVTRKQTGKVDAKNPSETEKSNVSKVVGTKAHAKRMRQKLQKKTEENKAENSKNDTPKNDSPSTDGSPVPQEAEVETAVGLLQDDRQTSENEERNTFNEDEIKKFISIASGLVKNRQTLEENTRLLDRQVEILSKTEKKINHFRTVYGKHQYIWRITNVNKLLIEAEKGTRRIAYSPQFFSHPRGYKMIVSLCPCGEGKVPGKYASLFFCLIKGEYDPVQVWPFEHEITFTLIDQSEERDNVTKIFTPNPCRENIQFLGRPIKERNLSIGFPKFISSARLREGCYCDNDTIYIKIAVSEKTLEPM